MNSSRWIKRWTKKNRLIKILVKSGLEFEFESRAHRDNILNSLKVNHFQGIFFFRGAQSGDQSNNKNTERVQGHLLEINPRTSGTYCKAGGGLLQSERFKPVCPAARGLIGVARG